LAPALPSVGLPPIGRLHLSSRTVTGEKLLDLTYLNRDRLRGVLHPRCVGVQSGKHRVPLPSLARARRAPLRPPRWRSEWSTSATTNRLYRHLF